MEFVWHQKWYFYVIGGNIEWIISEVFWLNKNGNKKYNIFHECKESKDSNKILTTSIKSELNENDNEDSKTNPLYSEDVENMIHKDIDEITIENNNTQHK